MLRKWMCLLWMTAMVLGMGGKGQASEITGTVCIVPEWCGRPAEGGVISLCRVGTKMGDHYFLTDGLANWSVEEEELNNGELSLQLAQGKSEIVRQVGGQSGAVFENLREGVYLVEQTEPELGYMPFAPFFLTVPEEESWEVYRAPKVIRSGESPRTGDRPAPIIAAMGLGFSVAVLMVLADERKK